MTKASSPEYLAKVKLLSKDEVERLLSRMSGKLPRRLEKDKLSQDEALAIQLELEDEQLAEWRKAMAEMRKRDAEKAAAAQAKEAKPVKEEKAKDAEKPKKAAKTKAAA